MGRPGVARRRARGRASGEDTEAAAENWGTLAPQAIPPKRAGAGPPRTAERDHGCRRASGSGVRGASHLGSGARARSSVPVAGTRAGHLLGRSGRWRHDWAAEGASKPFITPGAPSALPRGPPQPLREPEHTSVRRPRRRHGRPPRPLPRPTPAGPTSSWNLRPGGGAGGRAGTQRACARFWPRPHHRGYLRAAQLLLIRLFSAFTSASASASGLNGKPPGRRGA